MTAREQRQALLAAALEVSGDACAVLLDIFDRQGRLDDCGARWFVARSWDLCVWPMSTLPAERWVRLFRLGGYTHEFEPAEPPTQRLRLYRGSDAAGELGMCWSSNPDVARWMASKFGEGWVWVADVEPGRLLAFIAETYEDQFVVDTAGLVPVVVEDPEAVATLVGDELAARLDALVEGWQR